METNRKIKEKLKFILRSEKTTKFFDISSSLNYVINNSPGNTNNFIDKVFGDEEEDIDIELSNSHSKIDNLIIFDKRVMIKTISTKSTKFVIKTFNHIEKNKRSKDEMFKIVKDKLDFYDFVFFIRIDRNGKTKPFKVLYDFFLVPISYFTITINENCINWVYEANNNFSLRINDKFLEKYYLNYSYSYSY